MSALPTEYGPLVRELHRLAAQNRQPVNGTFELTERCNLACKMCYIHRGEDDKAQQSTELSAAVWLELARQGVDNGMVFLLLTGGEPLLRPDFFKIYTPLTKMGLLVTLFTNGTLITENIAARLAEAPPSRTEITLYGATAETYEAVTGVPGSFKRCLEGIEALVKYKIPLGLKSTLTRKNVHELEAMRQMAKDWGLPFSADWLLAVRRDGTGSGAGECRLPAADCVELEAASRASATDRVEAALREGPIENDVNFYCQAGRAAFVINHTGEMNTCVLLDRPSARPLDTGFMRAWEEVQRYIDTAPSLHTTCLACAGRSYCPRCPAWSQLESKTLNEPVPYLCQIAFARKELYEKQA